MFLRYSPERVDADLAYVRDMGLRNTVRLEGRIDHEDFFNIRPMQARHLDHAGMDLLRRLLGTVEGLEGRSITKSPANR